MPRLDFAEINRVALGRLPELLQRWLPGGYLEGHEYVARNPRRGDHRPGSFKINIQTGRWSDFATADSGGDPIALLAYLRELPRQGDAARALGEELGLEAGAPLVQKPAAVARPREAAFKTTWVAMVPVPSGVPAPPGEMGRRGAPSGRWAYRDAEGRLLGFVCRFPGKDGGKDFYPLTWCRLAESDDPAVAVGATEWRWQGWAPPRPLYGLDRLAARPDATVIVTEGEKAADAAGVLLPDCVAVTSPNGSKSAGRADWRPLAGRRVVIWRDADEPGMRYALDVARAAHAAGAISVTLYRLPDLAPDGWDAADAQADGWDEGRARLGLARAELLARDDPRLAGQAGGAPAAKDGEAGGGDGGSGGGRKGGGKSAGDWTRLLDGADIEFWRNPLGSFFVSVPRQLAHEPEPGHVEHLPVDGQDFTHWLVTRARGASQGPLGSDALETLRRDARARAWARFPEGVHESWRRVGRGADGAVYLDLGCASWRAVRITADGWSVVDRPACKFVRPAYAGTLPEPEGGGDLQALRALLRCESEGDMVRAALWPLGCLRPEGGKPVLVVTGPSDSGKSYACRLLARLIDPSAVVERTLPAEMRDLMISASATYTLVYDNVSELPLWLSDAFAKLATGAGLAVRRLHSDRDEEVFSVVAPVALNGITEFVTQPDLASRALAVAIRPFQPGETKRDEEEIEALFQRHHAELLGALLDAAVEGMKRFDETPTPEGARPPGFARFAVAAEDALGFGDGMVLAALRQGREDQAAQLLEDHPAIEAVRKWFETWRDESWTGPAAELLGLIEGHASDAIRRSKKWPQQPNALSATLKRYVRPLGAIGIGVETMTVGAGAAKRRAIRLIRRAVV